MACDCLSGGISLTANLGEPLSQPANDQRLVGPETKRFGLIQVDRTSQIFGRIRLAWTLNVLLISLERTQSWLAFSTAPKRSWSDSISVAASNSIGAGSS